MLNLPPQPQVTPSAEWRGMTLDEMRMRRTLVQARLQIQKFKLTSQIEAMKAKAPVFGGSNSLLSRLSTAFTFAEYALFAVKVFKLFRKRK